MHFLVSYAKKPIQLFKSLLSFVICLPWLHARVFLWENEVMSPNTFCVLVGAMKSGTTKLFHDLDCHPEICLSKPKETNYFVSLLKQSGQLHDTSKMLGQYSQFWPTWNSRMHKIALEASTNYSKFPFQPNVFPLIKSMMDSTGVAFKFIYILRNPFDAISSFYRHAFTANRKWASDHASAMINHNILSAHPLAIFSYAKQIDLIVSCFSRDSFLLIDFDDFVSKPAMIVSSIAAFLGIASDFSYRDSLNQHSVLQRIANHVQPSDLSYSVKVASWEIDAKSKSAVEFLLMDDMRRLHDNYGFDSLKWLS